MKKAVVNAERTIVTLTTSEQEAGIDYTVIADSSTLGLKNNQISDTMANFTGYEDDDVPPQIKKVEAESGHLVKVILNAAYGAIKPTSLHSDGSNFEIFTTGENPEYLNVRRVELEDQYTILLTTDAQIANEDYWIRMKGVESSAGRQVKASGLTKGFTGFSSSSILHNSSELRMDADFNGDGVIDFTDFTIFSSVYGETWQAIQAGEYESLDEALDDSGIKEPYDPVDPTTPVPFG